MREMACPVHGGSAYKLEGLTYCSHLPGRGYCAAQRLLCTQLGR